MKLSATALLGFLLGALLSCSAVDITMPNDGLLRWHLEENNGTHAFRVNASMSYSVRSDDHSGRDLFFVHGNLHVDGSTNFLGDSADEDLLKNAVKVLGDALEPSAFDLDAPLIGLMAPGVKHGLGGFSDVVEVEYNLVFVPGLSNQSLLVSQPVAALSGAKRGTYENSPGFYSAMFLDLATVHPEAQGFSQGVYDDRVKALYLVPFLDTNNEPYGSLLVQIEDPVYMQKDMINVRDLSVINSNHKGFVDLVVTEDHVFLIPWHTSNLLRLTVTQVSSNITNAPYDEHSIVGGHKFFIGGFDHDGRINMLTAGNDGHPPLYHLDPAVRSSGSITVVQVDVELSAADVVNTLSGVGSGTFSSLVYKGHRLFIVPGLQFNGISWEMGPQRGYFLDSSWNVEAEIDMLEFNQAYGRACFNDEGNVIVPPLLNDTMSFASHKLISTRDRSEDDSLHGIRVPDQYRHSGFSSCVVVDGVAYVAPYVDAVMNVTSVVLTTVTDMR